MVLAGIFLLYIAFRFYDQQFQMTNITADWNLQKPASINFQEKKEFETIFSNSFHYLDRGKQSYVFASSDGKYVLKFFDFKCQQSGSMPLLAPISKKRCLKKLERMIQGFEVAMNYDAANTGLVYVQLAPNPLNIFVVNVIDRFGITRKIDLAKVPFALQLKATQTRKVISKLLNNHDLNGAKERFHQILNMYLSEYQQGIIDLDHNVMYNTGFIKGKPIRLDVGRLKYDEAVIDPLVYLQDLNHVKARISEWLKRHFPQYADEITEDLKDNLP